MTRLALLAIALIALIPLAYAGEFATHQDYRLGPQQAFGLVVADFNGDGKPDVATANLPDFCCGNLSILLGNGDGTLQSPRSFSLGMISPFWMTSGDFNEDGKVDLAFANPSLVGKVGVMLGNGHGGFSAIVTYTTGAGSIFVTTADLNGDGHQDLITANHGVNNIAGHTVSVLLGNGDGTFQAQSIYNTGSDPHSVAVADLNGDGIPDLAVANQLDNTFSVLLGNGDGTFQPMIAYPTSGFTPNSIVAGDFNKDGRMDLAFANTNSNTVGVAIGNGDGTFQPAQTYATGKAPVDIISADLNGDGDLDLAAGNYNDSSVSVLLGNGDGTFQTRTDYTTGVGGAFVVAARDLNRDGKRDLITCGNDVVSVLLNLGTN